MAPLQQDSSKHIICWLHAHTLTPHLMKPKPIQTITLSYSWRERHKRQPLPDMSSQRPCRNACMYRTNIISKPTLTPHIMTFNAKRHITLSYSWRKHRGRRLCPTCPHSCPAAIRVCNRRIRIQNGHLQTTHFLVLQTGTSRRLNKVNT